jgi:hypothetical protein
MATDFLLGRYEIYTGGGNKEKYQRDNAGKISKNATENSMAPKPLYTMGYICKAFFNTTP